MTAPSPRVPAELTAVLDAVAHPVVLHDDTGAVAHMNPSALALVGFRSMDEARLRFEEIPDLFEITWPDGRPIALAEIPIGRALGGDPEPSAELRTRRRDRPLEYVALNTVRTIDAGGRRWFVVSIDDRTERRRAEEAARTRADELASVLASVPVPVYIARDREARSIEGNPAAVALVRGRAGANLSLSAPPGERPTHFQLLGEGVEIPLSELPLQRSARTGEPVKDIPIEVRFEDGTSRHLVGNAAPLRGPGGEVVGAVAAFQDVTERQAQEAELRASQGALRALAARLDRIREEEKTRIARDLHDDLGQVLSAMKLEVEALLDRVEALPAGGQGAALLDPVVRLAADVDEAVKAVQRVAAELRPAALDRLGLPAALRGEGRRFAERTGVRCDVSAPEALGALPLEAATALFRIAQEALTNVARHAGATRVQIALGPARGGVALRIDDDGRGISAVPGRAHALGQLGMAERAYRLGGTLVIGPGEGRGTRVEAWVPVAGGGPPP
jgi:hypothetical protein